MTRRRRADWRRVGTLQAMWTEADVPDQTGCVAVVTGANGGLGLELTRALAQAGTTVVMAARDQDKARAARQQVAEALPGAELDVRELDLASLASVRACAAGIVEDHPDLDLLVNNAGIMGIPERETADGFEAQLGVNHLGHFVLTRLLMPALLTTPGSRVVAVTSVARHVGRAVNPANPHLRGRYDPWRAYGQSKLANLQFALELHRRLEDAGAATRSLAAHPGLTHTDLQSRSVEASQGGASQRFWQAVAQGSGMVPRQGVLPLLRAATDPAARGGELYAPRWGTVGAPVRRPVVRPAGRAGAALWAVSEHETKTRFAIDELLR